ncbi:MAG: site-specific recombinase [Patescibacteria group bacterium]|nr:site-specific recombinase [Patescibacteria group bacterium]
MFSTGNYSRRDISDFLFAKGVMTSSGRQKTDDQVKSIVTNWIYAGFTHNKLSNLKPQKGRHKGIVSEETLNKCILVIEGNKNSYTQRGDELYPLRGTLLCSRCKNRLTASSPKGNGGHYPIYHCNKPTCTKKVTGKRASISTDKVHRDFRAVLDDMKPLTEVAGLFKQLVIRTWNKANREAIESSAKLEKELDRYLNLKNKTTELWIEEKITGDDYKLKCRHFEKQIGELRYAKSELENHIENQQEMIGKAMTFIEEPKTFWNQANLQVKKAVQELLFPSGVEYDFETGFGTIPKLKSSLLMEEISKNLDKNTSLVAVTGIEPVTSGL